MYTHSNDSIASVRKSTTFEAGHGMHSAVWNDGLHFRHLQLTENSAQLELSKLSNSLQRNGTVEQAEKLFLPSFRTRTFWP